MAHIRIAICDDDQFICGELETLLINILESNNITHDIDVFFSGEELVRTFNNSNTSYDLIFLDIELPNQNGIDIGTYIRENLIDHKTEISYISSNNSYAMDLFKLRPIDFLEKPITSKKVTHVINTYLNLIEYNNKNFQYSKNKNTFNIPLSDILYFEHKGRKTVLHTFDETIDFYDSFDNILTKLDTKRFILVHKSFIINYRCISKFGAKEVTMIDGRIIPISQSKRSQVQNKITELRMADTL